MFDSLLYVLAPTEDLCIFLKKRTIPKIGLEKLTADACLAQLWFATSVPHNALTAFCQDNIFLEQAMCYLEKMFQGRPATGESIIGGAQNQHQSEARGMEVVAYLYNNPNGVIDALIEKLELDSDDDLARFLGVSKTEIVRIRRKESKLTASLLLHMLELSDSCIWEIRNWMVIRTARYH